MKKSKDIEIDIVILLANKTKINKTDNNKKDKEKDIYLTLMIKSHH